MVTPLQPKEFFRGCWRGHGELVPHPLLRPFVRRERFGLSSGTYWLSETVWLVKDSMEFASGWVYRRKLFAELVGATGFEPATSWSQTKCSSQAELRSESQRCNIP